MEMVKTMTTETTRRRGSKNAGAPCRRQHKSRSNKGDDSWHFSNTISVNEVSSFWDQSKVNIRTADEVFSLKKGILIQTGEMVPPPSSLRLPGPTKLSIGIIFGFKKVEAQTTYESEYNPTRGTSDRFAKSIIEGIERG
jgi:hypothetical protein